MDTWSEVMISKPETKHFVTDTSNLPVVYVFEYSYVI